MTTYRFRAKYDFDPTSLWRDVVVGADRTVEDLQSTINRSVGLDEGHLWFVGTDEDYWDSPVKYQCPQEFGDPSNEGSPGFDDETYDAGETTIGELVDILDLEQYDRICYLYDYGDEWRFYAILKEISDDEPDDREPEVVGEKGESVHQYSPSAGGNAGPFDPSGASASDSPGWSVSDSSGASGADSPGSSALDPLDAFLSGGPDSRLPEPLDALPDTPIPTDGLRELEDREDVAHVIMLLSIETGFGAVTERFVAQYEDAGYLLEYYPDGWEAVEEIDGEGKPEEELLAELAAAALDWHAEITELTQTASGIEFDEATVEDMNTELKMELERKGYEL